MTPLDPRTARRRFVLLTAVRWLPPGVTIPVMVLLMASRGLSTATIGFLFAVHGFVTASLELPTGGLADVLGRRRVLLVSGTLNIAAALLLAVARDTAGFFAAAVTLATGRALGSGPLEAWYVDTVRIADPAIDLKPGLSNGQGAEALALSVGALAGGLLPLAFRNINVSPSAVFTPLMVPLLLAAAIGVAYLAAVSAWVVEPPRTAALPSVKSVARDVPRTVVDGLRLAVGSRTIRVVLISSGAIGLVISAMEVLAPLQFADLFGARETATAAYGTLLTVVFLATAAGASLAPLAARLGRGSQRAAAAFLALGAFFVTGMATGSVVLAIGGYVLCYFAFGGTGPLQAELLHESVGSAQRATMVSVQSLASQAGGVVGGLTLPLLAQHAGLPVTWLTAAAITLVGGAVLLAARDPHHGGHGVDTSAEPVRVVG